MIKHGAKLRGLQPEMSIAYTIAHGIYSSRGWTCMITSGVEEPVTPRRTMEHRTGRGLDLRSWHCGNQPDRLALADEITEALGPDYQVLLERLGERGEHIHIGYRPVF